MAKPRRTRSHRSDCAAAASKSIFSPGRSGSIGAGAAPVVPAAEATAAGSGGSEGRWAMPSPISAPPCASGAGTVAQPARTSAPARAHSAERQDGRREGDGDGERVRGRVFFFIFI